MKLKLGYPVKFKKVKLISKKVALKVFKSRVKLLNKFYKYKALNEKHVTW